MESASIYDRYCLMYSMTRGSPDLHNQRPEEYPGAVGVWCGFGEETDEEGEVQGANRTTRRVSIRVRGEGPVKPHAYLYDTRYNETWRVQSVTRGDWEWIASCYLWDGVKR